MAHIHLADGTFPLFWTVVWWILAIVAIAVAVYWLRNVRRMDNRTLTLAAFCTAAAFAIFQVNIPLYGGVHLNLTPLIGILTGPAVGGVIVLIVNILSAAIGHGGWGLIGANTLINLAEVFAAYGIYRGLLSLRMKAFPRAGIATLLALFLGNILMIGIIMTSGIQGVNQSFANILSGLSVLAGINMGVAVIEAIVTGYIVSYIEGARPDMLAKEASDVSEGR
jgi:cobalt/nickel transport system permease protein